VTRTLLRVLALASAAVALSACTAIGVANTAVRAAGTAIGAGTRVVSSTGDVIFDHDGDGR
jgi:hypothetical protein